jgi:hypothetical protein
VAWGVVVTFESEWARQTVVKGSQLYPEKPSTFEFFHPA